MSALAAARQQPRLVLLGTGTVGAAFVTRHQQLQRRLGLPALSDVANSRIVLACADAPDSALWEARLAPASGGAERLPPLLEQLRAGDIVVDATASEPLALWHARGLERGVHVVTANKLGQGGALERAKRIQDGIGRGGARYGNSATVGAGLPLLSSLRTLVAGGDRIHSIEGVLSGSMAWILQRFSTGLAFSQCVREAMAAGYTEPDPRSDLGGEDVRRKLLILARAACWQLESGQVQVQSLLTPTLAALPRAAAEAGLQQLDGSMAAERRHAQANGLQLHYIGRVDADGARVELRPLDPFHPLAAGRSTDNRVLIHSDRYRQQPLVIQGPGAGAEVTAAALVDDLLAITAAG